MKKLLLAGLLALLVAGCGTIGTIKTRLIDQPKVLEACKGIKTFDDAVANFGFPVKETTTADSRKLYQFIKDGVSVVVTVDQKNEVKVNCSR